LQNVGYQALKKLSNLFNENVLEHSGMHWSIKGADAILGWRSVHINNLERNYWDYYVEGKRVELYGNILDEEETEEVAA